MTSEDRHNDEQAKADPNAGVTYSANDVRLTGLEWIAVAMAVVAALVIVPRLWQQKEPLPHGPNPRICYDLSSDYWLLSPMAIAAVYI